MKSALIKITIVSVCVILDLTLVPNAAAQVAVIDSANLAQNLQTAAQEVIAGEQLKAQLAQL